MALDLTPWDNVSAFVDLKTGALTVRSQVWLQNVLEQLNDEFGALAAAQAALQAAANANAAAVVAQDAAAAASDAASGALTAADNAQGAADTAAADSSLASSGVLGLTLTAIDLGASARVTISAHTRVYGDGTSVSLNLGIINGLLYSTKYYIYYDDPTRAGGTVTYQASTSPNNAVQTGNRHSVGVVTTPASAGAPNNGSGYPAPGVLAI